MDVLIIHFEWLTSVIFKSKMIETHLNGQPWLHMHTQADTIILSFEHNRNKNKQKAYKNNRKIYRVSGSNSEAEFLSSLWFDMASEEIFEPHENVL